MFLAGVVWFGSCGAFGWYLGVLPVGLIGVLMTTGVLLTAVVRF